MSPTSAEGPHPRGADEAGEDQQAKAARAAIAEKEAALAQREAVVEERESRADAREGDSADRAYEVRRTVAAAEGRDDAAQERDHDADTRDRAANLDAFVNGIVDPRQVRERQRAGADRTHSKADRIASGVDRSTLTDTDPDVSGVNLRDRPTESPDDRSPGSAPD